MGKRRGKDERKDERRDEKEVEEGGTKGTIGSGGKRREWGEERDLEREGSWKRGERMREKG